MIAEGRAICIMPERSAVMPGIVTRTVEGMSLEREVVFVTVSGSGTPVEIRKIAQMAARHGLGVSGRICPYRTAIESMHAAYWECSQAFTIYGEENQEAEAEHELRKD
jgi:hypothetical protein